MNSFRLIFIVIVSLVIVSCGKDDEPNYPDQTMVVGETYAIPDHNGQWESDNPYIASVSDGLVTAERVGETCIRNGSNSFKVYVAGKYELYREPCLQWGASKSIVSSFMSEYTKWSESEDFLRYVGKRSEFATQYYFENGGLVLSEVVLRTAVVESERLVDFLTERYVYVTYDESQNVVYFVTPDENNIVLLQAGNITLDDSPQSAYYLWYLKLESSLSIVEKRTAENRRSIYPGNENLKSDLFSGLQINIVQSINNTII